MRSRSTPVLQRGLALAASLVVLRVTAEVVYGYRNYLPPNFQSDFLHGRESYFFGDYQWAFYLHIASGPWALLCGLLLMSNEFRRRSPRWHRWLGRGHCLNVLLLVTPSGFWMASRAAAGPVAGAGFAALAVATAFCTAAGWRFAVLRQFAVHRRWMWRSYLLLCSTVVLRIIGGLAVVSGISFAGLDIFTAWASWLIPLGIHELLQRRLGVRPVTSPADPRGVV